MQLLPRLDMESDLLRHGDTPSLELRFRPGIRNNINTLSSVCLLYLDYHEVFECFVLSLL